MSDENQEAFYEFRLAYERLVKPRAPSLGGISGVIWSTDTYLDA